MSQARRQRRPSGHSVQIAERRGPTTATRTRAAAAVPIRVVTQVVRDAGELTGPLEAELWASELLGAFWGDRHQVSPDETVADDVSAFRSSLIRQIARGGGVGARTALAAIAAVDGDELGLRAGRLATDLAAKGVAAPAWVDEIGKAQIVGAAVMREDVYDDASTVLLEARHPGGEVHAVGVMIDHNLGEMAKGIMVTDSIDLVAQESRKSPSADQVVRLEPVPPGPAAARIREALRLTDDTFEAPVTEDYADLRALALARCNDTPGGYGPAPPRLSREERDLLLTEFLSSPEGSSFAPESIEASVAGLAIDFCVDYGDGRPLRWSPTLVAMFMAGWVPGTTLPHPDLFERLPGALGAWVRFAGRKSGIPEPAIEATQQEIPLWREEMIESADPTAADPAALLLNAAMDAGVDLGDETALHTFLAAWNARDEIP